MRYTVTALALLAIAAGGCDNDQNGGGPGASATRPGDTLPSGPAVCKLDKPIDKPLLKIAVVPKGTNHEFWKSIHGGAVKAELELPGIQVLWKGPLNEDDRQGQIDVVENFINSGVDGIAIAPLDDRALIRPIRDAKNAGIPVVIMDSGLQAQACTDYASFVATDNYVGGQKGGRMLARLLGGKGNVLMMPYQIGSASTEKREQGFLDVMAEHPDIRIVSKDQYSGSGGDDAQNKGEGLLQKYTELDGIFCPNESTTFGMLLALREAKKAGKITFVGFDSSDKLNTALGQGDIHGLVVQDPLNMGYVAVKTLVAYLRGEEVKTRIDTGSDVATPQNLNEERIKELLSPPFKKYL